MKVTIPRVDVVMNVALYGIEVDIPDDIIAKGERAIQEWAIANPLIIDFAPCQGSETMDVIRVTGVEVER